MEKNEIKSNKLNEEVGTNLEELNENTSLFDFNKLNIGNDNLKNEAEQYLNSQNEKSISNNLEIVLATQEQLRMRKSNIIKFAEPVLKRGENAVFFPNTINVIQGQAGVHKSRLVENICSALLKLNGCENELLGFKRISYEPDYTVIYVDTERNLIEQFPYALQSIQMNAGYAREANPSNFQYISLVQISRKERFKTLDQYLAFMRNRTKKPLFIVLDVSTDCIEDFNRTDYSMELIDLMNMAINQYNVIFLCLIHENPKSDKARGHFGTELMNKASTVMRVGFEKDANQMDTDIICVKYLKCRSTARHAPFYVKYSKESKGLVLADLSEVENVFNGRKRKASTDDVAEFLQSILGDGKSMVKSELLEKLITNFEASERTIESRISELLKSEIDLLNSEGISCRLSKESIDKNIYFKLTLNEPF